MTKTYIALTDFWHKNVLVPAGELVEMTEHEVKYLLHAVEVFIDDTDDTEETSKEDAPKDNGETFRDKEEATKDSIALKRSFDKSSDKSADVSVPAKTDEKV